MTTSPQLASAQLASTAEAARVLNVSPGTLRRLVHDGQIPAYRVGRGLRFNLNELLGTRPMTHPASLARGERGT